MLPASDIAIQIGGYCTALAAVGHLLGSIDRWAHSPARLKNDIDKINRRLDAGNDNYSKGISKVNVKVEQIDTHLNAVDSRVSYIEGAMSRNDSPRPRTR